MAGRRSGPRSRSGSSASGGGQRDDRHQSTEHANGRADGASGSRRVEREIGSAADADPEAIARQICLRLLSAAPRTRAELAAALRRRGVPEEAAAAVLARFAEVKLIDDKLFARAWVESRHHGRGLAGRALGAELRQRGVTSAEIDAALEQLSPEQELATARELIERRLAGTAGLPSVARMRRLTGVLARKGYSPRLAYRVVREALEREADSGSVASYDYEVFPEPDEDEAPAEA
jgi:regulatory protein